MAHHKKKSQSPFPEAQEILTYLGEGSGASKRDIARAFHIRDDDPAHLKALLRTMIEEGLIIRDIDKRLRLPESLPPVLVVEVKGVDAMGDLLAKPVNMANKAEEHRIYIDPGRKRQLRVLGAGDRALVRLKENRDEDGLYYDAQVIKVLDAAPTSIIGVYSGTSKGGRIRSSNRRDKKDFLVEASDAMTAKHGDLVMAEPLPFRTRKALGLPRAKITEILGSLKEPRSISLIAIHNHDIPFEFPREVLAEASSLAGLPNDDRQDLTQIPFVTIDPADARDHDDAVAAIKDGDGWRILVAIADVAFYVRPGSALDTEARLRGNSCYFPDRVVPMLPDVLSNDTCSLVEGKNRPVMVMDARIDKNGIKSSHKFYRAIINSHGFLSYGETQEASEGRYSQKTKALAKSVIKPLYGAYQALKIARDARQPLNLDLPERRIELSDAGKVTRVSLRERLESHRLIEDFMILANIAAGETLEARSEPCMYRVHEEPSLSKLEELREFLKSLDLSLPKGQVIRPANFNQILQKAKQSPYADLVSDVVLKSQMAAYYSPNNPGHFGLALPRYAHFTSPIRRYADLVVHRALIRALRLGEGGLDHEDHQWFVETGEMISATERRAMLAERDSNDRYYAAYLEDKIGEVFEARISGVTRFGLFVRLEPTGADGLIPMRSLHHDYFHHDEKHHLLRGERTGITYRLADRIKAKLLEADQITGSLRLELVDDTANSEDSRRKHSKSRGKIQKYRKRRKASRAYRSKRR